ncbi:MAG: MinD/ParA family protein [Clostridium sp.]|nr:MinD/ParA family protein [Clostridium sp.]
MMDQAELLRQLVKKQDVAKAKAKIITITSGKGGVGKSNFIVNLAITLSNEGKKVLLFDADIGMGNDDILMGVYHKYNIMDVINGDISIDEGIIKCPNGVHLLPGGTGINNIEDLTQEQRDKFIAEIDKIEGYDYILIDTGAGVNRTVLAFIASSDECIFVLTPEPTSLTDGYSLFKAVKYFNIETHVNIIINRVLNEEEANLTFDKFDFSARKFLNTYSTYLGCIYEDKHLTMAVRSQVPVVLKHPKSNSAQSIISIANKLMGKESKIKGNGAKGLFNKLFDIFS